MAQPHYIRLDMLSHYNSEYLKNVPVYTEYYEKNDLCVGITINLPLNLPGASEVFAMLSIFRGKSGNTFNENDLEILSFFQPHLTKSLHNYMKPIFCKQIAPIESGECFSHIGYCILGEDNRILESSSLFDQMGSNHRQQITRKITDLKYKLNCQPSMATAFCKLDNLPVYLELTKTTFKHMQAYKCIIYNLSAFFHATLQQIKITYSLSDREYSIMELLLKGSRINEIATQQFISVSMVKKNIASLCEKLNIDSQKQLLSTLGLF